MADRSLITAVLFLISFFILFINNSCKKRNVIYYTSFSIYHSLSAGLKSGDFNI